jgi:hypothetical protein
MKKFNSPIILISNFNFISLANLWESELRVAPNKTSSMSRDVYEFFFYENSYVSMFFFENFM